MKHLLLSKSKTANSGFTLLEILVVLIIAGVLAAIAAPNWISYRANRQVQAVQSELRQLLEQAQTDARTKRETQFVQIEDVDGLPTAIVGADRDGDNVIDEDTLQEVQLGNDELAPDIISLNLRPGNGAAGAEEGEADFSFNYQGAVSNTFIIDIESIRTNRPHCVAAITLIGGLASESDEGCGDFETAIGAENQEGEG